MTVQMDERIEELEAEIRALRTVFVKVIGRLIGQTTNGRSYISAIQGEMSTFERGERHKQISDLIFEIDQSLPPEQRSFRDHRVELKDFTSSK